MVWRKMQWINFLFQVCADISHWWDWTLQMPRQCYRKDAAATCHSGLSLLSYWLRLFVMFYNHQYMGQHHIGFDNILLFEFLQASPARFEVWIFCRPVRVFWIQARVKQVNGGLWLPYPGKEMYDIETTQFCGVNLLTDCSFTLLYLYWYFL